MRCLIVGVLVTLYIYMYQRNQSIVFVKKARIKRQQQQLSAFFQSLKDGVVIFSLEKEKEPIEGEEGDS